VRRSQRSRLAGALEEGVPSTSRLVTRPDPVQAVLAEEEEQEVHVDTDATTESESEYMYEPVRRKTTKRSTVVIPKIVAKEVLTPGSFKLRDKEGEKAAEKASKKKASAPVASRRSRRLEAQEAADEPVEHFLLHKMS
jgi:hypothetical protein